MNNNGVYLTSGSPSWRPTKQVCIKHQYSQDLSSSPETEISLLPYKNLVVKSVITIPLTEIFNQSVLTGVYPAKLKYAKVIPVYKGEDEIAN